MRADELVAKAQERVARLDAESQARRAKVEEDFDIAQRARRAEAARAEEERERVSTQAARQRSPPPSSTPPSWSPRPRPRPRPSASIRDELTGRLLQARQLLTTLPDLGDRPQQPPRRPPRPAAERSGARDTVSRQRHPSARAAEHRAEAAHRRRRSRQPVRRRCRWPAAGWRGGRSPPARPGGGRGRRGPPAHGRRRGAGHPPAADAPAAYEPGHAPPRRSGPPTQAIDQPVGQGRH